RHVRRHDRHGDAEAGAAEELATADGAVLPTAQLLDEVFPIHCCHLPFEGWLFWSFAYCVLLQRHRQAAGLIPADAYRRAVLERRTFVLAMAWYAHADDAERLGAHTVFGEVAEVDAIHHL